MGRTPRCRGVTIAELLVAITLAAVVLTTALNSAMRQRRTADRIVTLVRDASQRSVVSTILPVEIASLSASAGDIVTGQASDTALQLRTAIATGIACDREVTALTIPLDDTDPLAANGVAAPVRSGDSAWWYIDATRQWIGRRIAGATSVTAACPSSVSASAAALHVTLDGADTIPAGAPIRVTRQLRYDFYRGSDGSWQLGVREWSDGLQRFAPPQPLAGPFAQSRAGRQRTGFRYFDTTGLELIGDAADIETARIGRVRITVLSVAAATAEGSDGWLADSVDVAIETPRTP